MNKTYQNIFISLLAIFPIYCAITIGESWDESYELLRGKITYDYLISFGEINKEIEYREYYSTFYYSLQYFFTKIISSKYQIELMHLVNLTFSFFVIFGISKLCKALFNFKVGRIAFIILLFYPIFFGHMSINPKDTILAFCHVWISYLLLRYLSNQKINHKAKKYIICLSLLAAMGTGIQLVFLASLIPIIMFFLFEIFIFNKIIDKNFSLKKLTLDIIKSFILFYFILIFFWIDTHQNIFLIPFDIFAKTLTDTYWTGWPFNLVNENYYLSSEVPKSYIFINLIYKSPEYFLFCYLIFVLLFFKLTKFFNNTLALFYYKFLLIIFILIFPTLILFIIPYPIYDGLRLFLWTIPYFCIIPALTIYFLIENSNSLQSKSFLFLLFLLFTYFLYNFISITPYHYTYLNFLNGKKEFNYKKFENDYWGTSIKELIKNSNLIKKNHIKISTCGVNPKILKKYLNKNGYYNITFAHPKESDYIVMTNRVILIDDELKNYQNLTNCFDKFIGDEVYSVKRNKNILSTIRKNYN